MPEPPEDRSPGWKRDPEDVSKVRYWNGDDWASTTPTKIVSRDPITNVDDPDITQTVESSGLALGLSFTGVALVGLGVFLPRFESRTFATIEQNSLVQSVEGLLLIVFAVGAAFATYRFSQGEGRRFSVLFFGALILFNILIQGTGPRLELRSIGGGGAPLVETAKPGLGIYTVGLGGALISVAGILLAGFSVEGVQPRPLRKTRQCPSCAETILMEANVCKHCGRDVD